MNALINSQFNEIERLLSNLGEGKSPILLGKYTGQEKGEERDALSRIAGKALEICHYDADTGKEIDSNMDCVRACYHCLLTYRNQRDHHVLNRHIIKELLLNISQGKIQTFNQYIGRMAIRRCIAIRW